MDYKYLFLGIISFVFGTLYLINLKKRLKKEYVDKMNSFDISMRLQGLVGGFLFVLIGVIMVYKELIKMF